MRNAKWLKDIRAQFNLTQSELADVTGLALVTIKMIETGKLRGSLDTWTKIEDKIDQISQVVRWYDKHSGLVEIKIKGDSEPLYKMISLALKHNVDIERVQEYLLMAEQLSHDALKHFDSDSPEYHLLDMMLKESTKIKNLSKHFEKWIQQFGQ